ncbi:phosphatase PAP2 family protein [Pseudomonas monsensis]|uniref:phosphatase PAP2 family protein n=1 Tax=Pseudomonas monsensis TaxID=2745509 RepID=UPI00300F36C0
MVSNISCLAGKHPRRVRRKSANVNRSAPGRGTGAFSFAQDPTCHQTLCAPPVARCWPGGHAATGFTLVALFFVLRDRRPRLARQAFIFAFALGSVFSISRMMQGAHFFSHSVWTAIFCWLICLGSYYWVLYRPTVKAEAVVKAQPVSA